MNKNWLALIVIFFPTAAFALPYDGCESALLSLETRIDSLALDRRALRDSLGSEVQELAQLMIVADILNQKFEKLQIPIRIERPEEVALGALLFKKANSDLNLLRRVVELIPRNSFYPLSEIYPITEISRLFSFRGLTYGTIWAGHWWQEAERRLKGQPPREKTEHFRAAAEIYFLNEYKTLRSLPDSHLRRDRLNELKDVFTGDSRRLIEMEPGPGHYFPLEGESLRLLTELTSQTVPADVVSLPSNVVRALEQTLDHLNFSILGQNQLIETGAIGDFYSNWWWRNSEVNGFTKISGANSQSLAAQLYNKRYDKKWKRKIYWPLGADQAPLSRSVSLAQIRVAVNEAPNGTPLSMEVLVKDPNGAWEPLFFERDGSVWKLAATVKGAPVKKVCMECHATRSFWPFSKSVLSPRPHFLKTPADFRAVGYRDENLIRELLEY